MKRFYHVALAMLIAVISFECQKEFSSDRTLAAGTNNETAPITATVQGNILNEYGYPEAGVKITVGTKTTSTDANGYFRITAAALDKNASVITAEKTGYFKAYRSFMATRGTNQVGMTLTRKKLAGIIPAASGGQVILTNGARILLPANGVTQLNGQPFKGDVTILAAYIDPTSKDIGARVPGSFMGNDQHNERVVLSSFGMLAVELQSSTGEKLQIANGNAATLTMPVPAGLLQTAPADIPLWYVDEQTGLWKEQGSAKKVGNNYVGAVQHFSYWNCDLGLPAISFTATFKTAGNVLLKNLYLRVRTLTDTSRGYAHGYTDSLGQASGMIPSNASLVLEVLDPCYNVMYYKNIGPFSQHVDLGNIVVPNSASSLVTVTGILTGCNKLPLSNGTVAMYADNLISYIKTDANGKFSTAITRCAGLQPEIELLGIDAVNKQQGNVITIPLTGQLVDVGEMSACGVSSTEYINFTLDGVDHEIILDRYDSLRMQIYILPGNLVQYDIWGNYKLNDISFNFKGKAAASVYPMDHMAVTTTSSYADSVQLIQPFNVTITVYPQHIGEFCEGSFSGSFKYNSSLAVLHTISGNFRVKRE